MNCATSRTAAAFRLAVVSVKRVVWTYRHIKTGWRSSRRVAHLRMAAARNRHAADNGASNLRLCSSGGNLRVTLVVRRRGTGRHRRKCKHNGRNNGYDCLHGDLLTTHERLRSAFRPNRPAIELFLNSRSSLTDAAYRLNGPSSLEWKQRHKHPPSAMKAYSFESDDRYSKRKWFAAFAALSDVAWPRHRSSRSGICGISPVWSDLVP